MSYWSSPVSLAKFSVHRALNSTLARRSYKHCFHLYGQEFFWEVGIMGYQHRISQRQWPCHCVFTCHAPHFWEVMYEQTTLGESGRLQLCRWLELTCAAVSSLYKSLRGFMFQGSISMLMVEPRHHLPIVLSPRKIEFQFMSSQSPRANVYIPGLRLY